MKAVVVCVILFLLLDQCCGEAAVALLRAESDEWSDTYCTVYNPSWGHVPVTQHPTSKYPVTEASDRCLYGCTPLHSPAVGAAVVALRGNCSFCEKAWFAESANASLVVVVYNDSDLLVDPECASGDHTPSIPVLLVANQSGQEILQHLSLSNVTLSPFTPPSIPIDPSAAITMVIAVLTVLLASYIANTPFEFLQYGLLVRKGESYGKREAVEEEGGSSRKKAIAATILAICVFIVLICVLLLLLYYFYYPMVYIVIAVYCVGAVAGLYYLLSPFAALIPLLRSVRLPENKVPLLEYRPDPRFPLLLLLCLGFVVWWLVERHSIYGWVLQDILGFAFVAYLLSRLMFLPVWVVAIAMVLLFFYDIIMVFITPFLTQDHESVMVKAATGGDSNNEPLPIVFVVPKLLPSSLERACASLTGFFSYSLLGYGDVGVPGLLVTLCLKFDMRQRPKSCCRLYFAVAGIAYTIGLLCTFVALVLMKTAQPALLYLVPTTLGSVTFVATVRREFTAFFTGEAPKQQTHRRHGQVQEDTVATETETENEPSDTEKETLIHNEEK